MTEGQELPENVLAAYGRAARTGFRLACEVEVGRLLAALAAAVPGCGRVLEIGTGVGAGLAWLVHGLGARQDVEVVTVAALREGGVIVVDDMDLARHADEQLRSALAVVRHRLLDNAELVRAELGFSSGVIVAVKRRP